jgi:hypothetical protein
MQVLKSKSGHFIKAGLKRIYLPDKMDPTTASTDELVALLGIESGKKIFKIHLLLGHRYEFW